MTTFLEKDKVKAKEQENLIKKLVAAVEGLSEIQHLVDVRDGSDKIIKAINGKKVNLDQITYQLSLIQKAVQEKEVADNKDLIAAIRAIEPSSLDMSGLMAEMKEGNAKIISSLTNLLESVNNQPQEVKPREWEFEIVRDKFANNITSIKAKAVD